MRARVPGLVFAVMATSVVAQDARMQSWARHVRLRDQSPFRGLNGQSLGPRLQGGRVQRLTAVLTAKRLELLKALCGASRSRR